MLRVKTYCFQDVKGMCAKLGWTFLDWMVNSLRLLEERFALGWRQGLRPLEDGGWRLEAKKLKENKSSRRISSKLKAEGKRS
jgi:hypothetical protein